MLTRFDCYELCVQSPRHVAEFLRGLHGEAPTVLREDFCGTAAISRRWAADAARQGELARAVAVDLDPDAVAEARRRAGVAGVADRVEVIHADALAPAGPGEGCDCVFVGNFSIGYIHDRSTLVRYLRESRQRLAMGRGGFGGGVFACDTYGGAGAYRLGGITRRHPSQGREVVHYHWTHDAADPRTAMVENSISFRVEIDGEVVAELPRAFVYRWRLWSMAELRDAMLEAGFESIEVYRDINVAPGRRPVAVAEPAELGDDWIVVVAAR